MDKIISDSSDSYKGYRNDYDISLAILKVPTTSSLI
jgi:hypothetical protein